MTPEPGSDDLLVVGKDVDGSWTVREGAGAMLARFATRRAALGFAERRRRSRPAPSIASPAGVRPRPQGRLTLAIGHRRNDAAAGDA